MDSLEFLQSVWNLNCSPGDYVCISTKHNNRWEDHMLRYSEDMSKLINPLLEAYATGDIYFCPLPFAHPRRKKENVSSSKLLWSDIDTGSTTKYPPSILWESSPGRYQGLWVLPKTLPPEKASELSKRLAYDIGADKGGWDLTQVLRIPGTKNRKYATNPEVKLLRFDENKVFKGLKPTTLDKYRDRIPPSILRTLAGPATVGKRSEVLWKLGHELANLKIPKPDIIRILKASPWNKFAGRADEDERFESEMEKITTPPPKPQQARRLITLEELMKKPIPRFRWLVPGFWPAQSCGIVAGEAKTFKSTTVIDMAFSIATGTPFLGKYKPDVTGPVIIIQNENSAQLMSDRFMKLIQARGQFGSVHTEDHHRFYDLGWPPVPNVHMLNESAFSLTDPDDRDFIVSEIQRINPVLTLFDPLYTMFTGNLNSAEELTPTLNWLTSLKQYGTSVILVHHLRKATAGEVVRAGQRMLGSSLLHNWIEAAWYLAQDKQHVCTLSREFRSSYSRDPINLRYHMADIGKPGYEVEVQQEHSPAESMFDEIQDATAKVIITRFKHDEGQTLESATQAARYLKDASTGEVIGKRAYLTTPTNLAKNERKRARYAKKRAVRIP